MLDFIENYGKEIDIVETDDGYDITLPFAFFNGETVITLHVQQTDQGFYFIDDKGATLKYLDNLDTSLELFYDKVGIICNLFALRIEKGVVLGIIGYGEGQLYKQLHYYLQGISHLSTLKYFE